MRVDWERVARTHVNPVRQQLLELMVKRPPKGSPGWSPKTLAAMIELPLPNVSYHIKELRDLGLLTLVDTAPRRGAVEHYYKLEATMISRKER